MVVIPLKTTGGAQMCLRLPRDATTASAMPLTATMIASALKLLGCSSGPVWVSGVVVQAGRPRVLAAQGYRLPLLPSRSIKVPTL